MSSRLRSAHGRARTSRIDPDLLHLSDRACLRLLERTRTATAEQLGILVYPSHRTALRRTRGLWLHHFVIRESLAPERGGIPVAYRLSPSGRRRLHSPTLRSSGLLTTRHSLDGVELVAALVRHDPGLVQLWYPESMVPSIADDVHPDGLVVLDTGEGSALVLIEVDESTERAPVIRDRLAAYARLFEAHPTGWHVLWVVNSPERLRWIRQVAAPTKLPGLAGRSWGVPIDTVSGIGAVAPVLSIGASLEARPLRALAADPSARRSDAAVGSPAWIRLVAAGGREEMTSIWNGVARAPGATAEPPVTAAETPAAVAGAAASPSPSARAPDPPPADPPVPAPDPEPDLELMFPHELVQLMVDDATDAKVIERAALLLVERENWYFLFEALERMSASRTPEPRLRSIELLRRVRPFANRWFRQESRGLLLKMVDPRFGARVVEAALCALDDG